jgi:excisionase family DNA binding protein
MIEEKKFYSIQEASEYLGISVHWLYKLTSHKKIKFYKPSPRKIFFLKPDLDRFILSNPVVPDSEIKQKAIDREIS